jgi:hypothetical protein
MLSLRSVKERLRVKRGVRIGKLLSSAAVRGVTSLVGEFVGGAEEFGGVSIVGKSAVDDLGDEMSIREREISRGVLLELEVSDLGLNMSRVNSEL